MRCNVQFETDRAKLIRCPAVAALHERIVGQALRLPTKTSASDALALQKKSAVDDRTAVWMQNLAGHVGGIHPRRGRHNSGRLLQVGQAGQMAHQFRRWRPCPPGRLMESMVSKSVRARLH